MSHVAQALGTDRASLYYYFSNKEEMFREAVTEAVSVNLQFARDVHALDAPAPQKLRQLIEGLMTSYGAFYPVLYNLIKEDLSQVKPQLADWARDIREVNREYERILVAIVQEGQDAGTVRAHAPAWVLSYGIMGMLGWTNRWFDPNTSPESAEAIGAAFAESALHGLAI